MVLIGISGAMHWGVWLSLAMLRFRAFRMCQLVLRMVLWPLFSPTLAAVFASHSIIGTESNDYKR